MEVITILCNFQCGVMVKDIVLTVKVAGSNPDEP
jgi:hypothetical protein